MGYWNGGGVGKGLLYAPCEPPETQLETAHVLAGWPWGMQPRLSFPTKRISLGWALQPLVQDLALAHGAFCPFLPPVLAQSWGEPDEARARLPAEPHQVLPCPAQVGVSCVPSPDHSSDPQPAPLQGLADPPAWDVWTLLAVFSQFLSRAIELLSTGVVPR